MGWRVTVKAGKVRDMKNKRKTGRKTGKSGKKRWVGGKLSDQQKDKYDCFPLSSSNLLCNYDKEHNRYEDIGPFLVNDVLNRHIASYVPVSYLSDKTEVDKLIAWNTDLDNPINCGKYDMTNLSKLPYDLKNYQIQPGDFILSEAPISKKFYDFWDIVITMKIDVIVMLTNLIENGIIKAAKYFPDRTTTELEFGTISVVLTNYRADTNKNGNTPFEISTFTVKKNNVEHTVTHLWYKAWPDRGVVTLDAFNTLIQKYYDHTNDASKTLVHCSAGVGRTGTFVAALLYCRFLKQINIDIIILFLRKCRMIQVQTIEQYALLIENQIKILQRPNVAAAAARPIVAATESSGISASAAATRPAAVEGVARPASTVAAVAANFTSITKTDLPPELRKYYHDDDDLSTLYTNIDTFIENHRDTFFFYIRNSRTSNKLAISFHNTNLLTNLHKSYYISKDTQSNKFILQDASTHNKVDTLPEQFRLYIGLQSDFTLDNPANSKNALSIFVHDTTQPAAVEGVAQHSAVDAASVQPTPLTSLESAVQSVIKKNSGINVTSQLVQSRSPEQAIAATAGVDQPTTVPPVTASAQGTTSAVVPAPAIATAETSSADDDEKEGSNTLPASGVIPSNHNLSSDPKQPTKVATAAASNTAPTTTPITAPITAPNIAPTTAPVVNTTVSTTVVAAPTTTHTIVPVRTIPESLHTSVAVIQQTTYDPTTKSTTYTFDNGKSIITKKSNTNSHVFDCTISSQT